jgi:hypothetical protein
MNAQLVFMFSRKDVPQPCGFVLKFLIDHFSHLLLRNEQAIEERDVGFTCKFELITLGIFEDSKHHLVLE